MPFLTCDLIDVKFSKSIGEFTYRDSSHSFVMVTAARLVQITRKTPITRKHGIYSASTAVYEQYHNPPACPLGVGLTQHNATFTATPITPMIQKLLA